MISCQCLLGGIQWETLLAGVMASFAAFKTVEKMQRQIKQANDFREDEMRRKRQSTMMQMPLAFFEIFNLADKASRIALAEAHRLRQPEDIELTVEGRSEAEKFVVTVSDETKRVIQVFVETLDNQCDVRHVSELITQVGLLSQSFRSYTSGPHSNVLMVFNVLLSASAVGALLEPMRDCVMGVSDEAFGVVGGKSISEDWLNIRAQFISIMKMNCVNPEIEAKLLSEFDSLRVQRGSPWDHKIHAKS